MLCWLLMKLADMDLHCFQKVKIKVKSSLQAKDTIHFVPYEKRTKWN